MRSFNFRDYTLGLVAGFLFGFLLAVELLSEDADKGGDA